MRIEFALTPLGAPRQSRRDVWSPSLAVQRYRLYKDELRLAANRAHYTPDATLDIVFRLPMPPSWSQRKRDLHRDAPHQQKPDIDNLVKGFLDTLLPESDCHVWSINARKFWADTGSIVIYTDEGR